MIMQSYVRDGTNAGAPLPRSGGDLFSRKESDVR